MPTFKIAFCVLLCCVVHLATVNAGVVIKKNSSTHLANRPQTGALIPDGAHYWLPHQQNHHPEGNENTSGHSAATKSWAGIASLIFGIIGLASVLLPPYPLIFSICAIIFGAIGFSKKRKKRGLAIAGFVLGTVLTAVFLGILIAFLFFIPYK